MNNFSLIKCRVIYKEMQQQIENAARETADETKWIERAFAITIQTWFSIEKEVNSYRFTDQKEEISFYKTVKPQFTGLVDYFTLLYKSVLFQPDDFTGRNQYWKDELKTCRKFISLYKTAFRHYRQQDIITDLKELNTRQPLIFGANIKLYDINSTSYTYAQSRLIALKKYIKFLKEKKVFPMHF